MRQNAHDAPTWLSEMASLEAELSTVCTDCEEDTTVLTPERNEFYNQVRLNKICFIVTALNDAVHRLLGLGNI